MPAHDTDLFETGVLDSLGFVELLLQLEQRFCLTTAVHELDAAHFSSIERIADFVIERGGATVATGRVVPMRARR